MERNQEETIVDVCQQHVYTRADEIAYTFLDDQEAAAQSVTFTQLWKRAEIIAAHLLNRGLQGQRVLLVYTSGLDFILAFIACLRAGIIAAPVSPPLDQRQQTRLLGIAENFRSTTVLTTQEWCNAWSANAKSSTDRSLTYISTNSLPSGQSAPANIFPALCAAAPAFVQYTSGSTGNPKGVMVSHRNIMHNQRLIKTAFGHDETTVFAGWLPLFHDMGLIGNVLHPLFLGIQSVLMTPMRFLSNPVSWLKLISDYRATTSGGPNFAYDYCVSKIKPESIADLDLSCWRVAFNGAEPVRAQTMQKFAARFGQLGFAASAFYPCYGLAEATLFVTGGESDRIPTVVQLDHDRFVEGTVSRVASPVSEKSVTGQQPVDRRSLSLVSCGQIWLDDGLGIVNPESGSRCGIDEVGEIWLHSASVAQGYWDNPEETEKVFKARIKGDSQVYLRTGDLGFVNADNELFVTGRLSDLIIVRGRNYYPQDIELTAVASHPSLGPTAAAVKHDSGNDKVYLFQELRANVLPTGLERTEYIHIKNCINERVWQEHELRINEIHLLTARSIPKTSSGKVRRKACLERHLKPPPIPARME